MLSVCPKYRFLLFNSSKITLKSVVHKELLPKTPQTASLQDLMPFSKSHSKAVKKGLVKFISSILRVINEVQIIWTWKNKPKSTVNKLINLCFNLNSASEGSIREKTMSLSEGRNWQCVWKTLSSGFVELLWLVTFRLLLAVHKILSIP